VIERLVHPFEQFHTSYVAMLVMGLVLGYLGVFLVLRRSVFLGVTLAQASVAGVAGAFFGESFFEHGTTIGEAFEAYGASVGALVATIATVLGLDAAGRGKRVSREALLGGAYVAFGGSAVLLLWKSGAGMEELRNLLARDVLFVAPFPLRALLVGLAVVSLFHAHFRKELLFASYDPEMARTLGLRVRLLETGFSLGLALAVALSMRVAGALPIFAFLSVPAVVGLQVGHDLREASLIALGTAAGASFLGLAWANEADLPVAPTVASSLVLIGVVVAALNGLGRGGRRAGLALLSLLSLLAAAALGVSVLKWVGPSVTAPRTDVEIAKVSSQSAPTAQTLIGALRAARDPKVRAEAARGLALSTDPLALGALVRALGDDDHDVAEAALQALLHEAARPRAGDELAKALRSDEPGLKLHAALALLKLDDRLGVRGLLDLLVDTTATVPEKEEAVDALVALSGGDRKGYDPWAGDEANHASVVRWEAWWKDASRRFPGGKKP
jgi:zinc transport system permease protein